MELHNKFRKEVKSPINNETINKIEQIESIPVIDSNEKSNDFNLKRSSVLSESSSTLNRLNNFENNKQEKNDTLSVKNNVLVRKNSHRENVFKKLKSKFKEKLDL
jgi:hypothetical protein